MKTKLQYENDRNSRWRKSTQLTPKQVKQLIEDKLKRAIMLSEAEKKVFKQS